MSGLAEILLSRGIQVSGSDPSSNEATERLAAHGATLYRQQSAENLEAERPDFVIATAAIPPHNPELVAARQAGIPVETRAEFLGRLMSEFQGPRIAVAGTHGKTTTTAMVAEILISGGLDPTVLVGGEYAPIGGTARVGRSSTFLTEACEAYDSFLSLRPDLAIITNVEADHLDHYGDEAGVFEAFVQFARRVNPAGCLILSGDDPGCRSLSERLDPLPSKTIRYGLDQTNDVLANELAHEGTHSHFRVLRRTDGEQEALGQVTLNVPGRHNVLNALGAVALGLAAGVPFEAIVEGLERFAGTGRRYEVLGERDGVLVVDDYAHHPTEIRATLSAARQAHPNRRLVAVFQPHLYSRTRDFMGEFAAELAEADAVLLTDVYAAREQPIPGVCVSEMSRLIAERAPNISLLYLPKKEELVGALDWVSRPGDVILTMGAGDIREVGEAFLASRAA